MENSTERPNQCSKCKDVLHIIQCNEQMIQEQVQLIKKLHQENIILQEKCLNLEKENLKLTQMESKRLCSGKQSAQQDSQTDSFLEDLFAQIDKLRVQAQELRERVESSSKTRNEQSQHNLSQNNKENLQKIIPIVITKKDEQFFSRKRKNSYEEEHHKASWLKAINSSSKFNLESFKSKTVELVKKFVPHEMRHIVWTSVAKNTLMISEELYFILQQRRNQGWVSKQVKNQIEKDITRSFANKNQLSHKEGLKIEITEVLEMFHLYRPDVSYIQGMTYPIIVLTVVTGKVKAFRMFANLVVCNSFFRKLYTFESQFVVIVTKAFQFLLIEYHPEIAERLANQKIDPKIFLIEWFYTIFSRSFSFETTLKFWDHLLYFGEVLLYRVALSIMELIKGHIMDSNFDDTIGLIQGFSGYIREEKLLQLVVNHKLSAQKLERTFEKVEKCLQKYIENS